MDRAGERKRQRAPSFVRNAALVGPDELGARSFARPRQTQTHTHTQRHLPIPSAGSTWLEREDRPAPKCSPFGRLLLSLIGRCER